MAEKNKKPMKLEMCLVATHEEKSVIEKFCEALNVKPRWIKEKGREKKYHIARIWFKRRLPPDYFFREKEFD